ncbi:MAG: DUF5591 domain-containing protein [Candidatus Thermoplasmatota archaeon]|nr:DUF5591 domain-containing protein [Candidatus Thermoplasmatota archaeon]
MSEGPWSYHFGSIDVLSRMGELRLCGSRYQLPLLLDPLSVDGDFRTLPILSKWEGVGIDIRDVEPSGDVPWPLLRPQQEALKDTGALSLVPVISSARKALFCGPDGKMQRLPVHVLPYFSILMREPRKAAEALKMFAIEDSLHLPIYLPGVVDRGNLEVLFYLGVEVFDTIIARMDGMKGLYYSDIGPIPYERLTRTGRMPLSCGCSGCLELAGVPPLMEARRSIIAHNIEQMMRRLTVACLALQEGNLRELVMSRLAGDPGWMSAVRSVERSPDPRMLAMTPSFRSLDRVKVTYKDDLNAPDFSGWGRSIIDRYRPIESRTILLLLPCSARKPYSTSRTHQRVRDALNGVKGWRKCVQQVVITSPLGAVPMELEDLYPASHYDIPVTGEWFPEELQRTRELVDHIFKAGKFDHVVCFHREGGEFFPSGISESMFKGASFTDIHTVADKGSEDPYHVLGRTIKGLVSPSAGGNFEVDERLSEIRFSLDADLASLSGIGIRWSRRGRELISGGKPLIIFKKGGPVPTSLGGRAIWDLNEGQEGKRVIIGDFEPKGTVFSQGILDTHGEIRNGDIVLVGTENEYRGVGRALVPSLMMKGEVHGPAVRMINRAE